MRCCYKDCANLSELQNILVLCFDSWLSLSRFDLGFVPGLQLVLCVVDVVSKINIAGH